MEAGGAHQYTTLANASQCATIWQAKITYHISKYTFNISPYIKPDKMIYHSKPVEN